MLVARRMTCATLWSSAKILGARRHIPPQPSSVISNAPYTINISNTTAWLKRETVGVSSYSQASTGAGATITAANLQPDGKMLKVQWADGSEDLYPYIWLRDNCQCPACFHPVSLARRVLLKDLDPSVSCADIKLSYGGEQIEVQWTDGHQGTYSAQWLQERAFRGPQHEPLDRQCSLLPEYWGRELMDNLPRASFWELLRDDAVLLTFLENLETRGVVLVSDVPTQMNQIHRLTQRVGHLKVTHYGETFNVHNKLDPNNLAYTGDSLDMHTDLTYMAAKPSIQLLHCIKQFTGEGGDTLLTDGFAAASKLRKKNPKYFDTLAQIPIDFVDIGVDDGAKFHARWRAPIIELAVDGSIRTVNWHQMSRDSRFPVSSEAASVWYSAALAFRDLLCDPSSVVTLKLQPGDLIVLDNFRVLHGRQGYRSELGERILQGGYWEWDSVRSLRRVLRKEMTA